jgi:hypothetical protein
LLHRVFHGLFGEAVLQLESSDGQAIDEEAKIERELCLVAAVFELARDAEQVGVETLGGLWIARRSRAVEEVEVVRAVLDAAAKNVNYAALGDFTLKAGEELLSCRPGLVEVKAATSGSCVA